MKNNQKNFLKPLVLLLIAIAFASFVFVFVTDGKLIVCCHESRPYTSNSIMMADWKTYNNEKYGFELKYPPGWDIYEGQYPGQIVVLGNPNEGLKVFSINFSVKQNPDKLPVNKYVAKVVQQANSEPIGVLMYKKEFPIFINGINGYELYDVFAYDQQQEDIFISRNTEVFRIQFPMPYDDNSNIANPSENNKIAHQILSTFKFTK